MFSLDVRIEPQLLLFPPLRVLLCEFLRLKSLRTVLTVLISGSRNDLVQNVTIRRRACPRFSNFALPQRELSRGSGQESCKRCSGSVTG